MELSKGCRSRGTKGLDRFDLRSRDGFAFGTGWRRWRNISHAALAVDELVGDENGRGRFGTFHFGKLCVGAARELSPSEQPAVECVVVGRGRGGRWYHRLSTGGQKVRLAPAPPHVGSRLAIRVGEIDLRLGI